MKMKAPFHPCMNNDAHDKVARIHLPIAPECNIQCRFCSRKITPHDTKTKCPGRATRILTPAQALEKARAFRKKWGPDSIIGIAGPGDPLANPETFETLEERIHDVEHKIYPRVVAMYADGRLKISGRRVKILDKPSK